MVGQESCLCFQNQRGFSMRRFLLVFVLLLTACGAADTTTAPVATQAVASNDPCAPDALRAYQLKYTDVIDRWGTAVIVAGQAKPADLQGPIDTLQKVETDLAAIQPPQCALQAHNDSIEAMKMSISGYLNLKDQKDVGTTLREAIDKLSAARTTINALPGQPAPTPTALPTFTPQATWTPMPTAEPTATAVPTATPLPRNGVVGSSRTQVFETSTSDNPVKTLLKNTPVLVFEVEHGRLHIRANGVDGWVSQSSIIVK
jgi:TolA-binding protein